MIAEFVLVVYLRFLGGILIVLLIFGVLSWFEWFDDFVAWICFFLITSIWICCYY